MSIARVPPGVLVASGLGASGGGGLYAVGASQADPIDRLSTTGVAVSPDGSALARALFDPEDDPQISGEIARYDRRGAFAHQRVDPLREAHTLRWEPEGLLVVSTLGNEVLRLDDSGRPVERWALPGLGDCWHVNGLVRQGPRLLASAFGRFDEHRGWARPGARQGEGIVFDLTTGDDVLTGLDAPHDPTPVTDGWLICNSGTQELLHLGHDGSVLRRVALGGWTRGLAIDDDTIHVGVSARRHADESRSERACVVSIDRSTFAERGRVPLDCQEVFALTWVDPALVEGVRVGWANSPARRTATAPRGIAPAPLPAREVPDHRLVVSVDPPEQIEPGQPIAVQYTATNRGRVVMHNVGPEMIVVAGAWETADGRPAGSEARARLTSPILPGESITGTLRLTAPVLAGEYRLRVAALQEGFVWFDALDATLGGRYAVEVSELEAPALTP